MDKIWVISRSQGEYSDRSVSCVCWFPSKVAAETFVTKAQGQSRDAAQRWRKIEDATLGEVPDSAYQQFMDGLGLLDKSFDPCGWDADGVYYFATEITRGAITA
jgi:hypothetical protein